MVVDHGDIVVSVPHSEIIRLAIAGAAGRTGRCVLGRAAVDERFTVVAALVAPGCAAFGEIGRDARHESAFTDSLDVECDMLIDFTVAAGTVAWLDVCVARAMPMVIGATGHDAAQRLRIERASRTIPIVVAANFSVGVQAVMKWVGQLARDLGTAYDVEIVETHHRRKRDAPSGTALSIAVAVADATGRTLEHSAVYGRFGATGERPAGEIGIHSVRMGEIVSRHEIHFSGPGETITVRHEGHSRDTFALGALRAAAWVVGKSPGLYTMRDVLDSPDPSA